MGFNRCQVNKIIFSRQSTTDISVLELLSTMKKLKRKKIQQIKQSLNINLPQKKILKCFARSQPRRHLGNCQVRKRSNSQHLYLTSQQHMTLLVMRDTLIALEHGVSVTQRKYTTYQVVKSVCVSLLLLEKHQKHHSIHSPSF